MSLDHKVMRASFVFQYILHISMKSLTVAMLLCLLGAGPLFGQQKEKADEFIDLANEPHLIPSSIDSQYYPALAAAAGIEGLVRLDILIDTTGTVVKIENVNSSGSLLLDYGAIDMLRGAKFTPAIALKDTKVKIWVTYPINFKLDKLTPKTIDLYEVKLPKEMKQPLIVKVPYLEKHDPYDVLASMIIGNDGKIIDGSILPSVTIEQEEAINAILNQYQFAPVKLSKRTSVKNVAFIKIKLEMN